MLHLVPESEDGEVQKPNPFNGIQEIPKWQRLMELASQFIGLLATLVALVHGLWDMLPL
jgi:hypothetical protein